jgi:hypothetical protein
MKARDYCLIGFIVGSMLLVWFMTYYGSVLTKLYTEGFQTSSGSHIHVHYVEKTEQGEYFTVNGQAVRFGGQPVSTDPNNDMPLFLDIGTTTPIRDRNPTNGFFFTEETFKNADTMNPLKGYQFCANELITSNCIKDQNYRDLIKHSYIHDVPNPDTNRYHIYLLPTLGKGLTYHEKDYNDLGKVFYIGMADFITSRRKGDQITIRSTDKVIDDINTAIQKINSLDLKRPPEPIPTPTTPTTTTSTPTPVPTTSTPTPVPTTSTPVPTTSTPVPTTSTPVPTTSTPVPTTSTPTPVPTTSTPTPVPTTSTPTPVPTTSTPVPVPTVQGGSQWSPPPLTPEQISALSTQNININATPIEISPIQFHHYMHNMSEDYPTTQAPVPASTAITNKQANSAALLSSRFLIGLLGGAKSS